MLKSAFTLSLLLSLAGPSAAQVVFDTFDVGDFYDTGAYTIPYYQAGIPPWFDTIDADMAMAFTADTGGGTSTLAQIDLALSLQSGDNEVDITLTTDIGGFPGIVMETWHLSGALPSPAGLYPPTTVTSVLEPTLTDGQTYWVVLSASGPTDSDVFWYHNTVGFSGLGAGLIKIDGVGSWVYAPATNCAMRIIGRLDPVGNEGAAWSAVKEFYR